MATTYEIWIKSPGGTTLMITSNFISIDLQRTVNDVGKLNVVLPYTNYLRNIIAEETILEVWRSVDGRAPYLEGGTIFFVTSPIKKMSRMGETVLDITALDAIWLLAKTNIAYNANSSYTSKTAPADNMMNAFVRENLGSLATDTLRDLSSVLSVQNDIGKAPTVSKGASRRQLLTVLQEIANASYTAGKYLAFDIISQVSPGIVSLQFQTFTDFRGNDHRLSSNQPVLLNPDYGSLTEVASGFDLSNQANVVYAGGQGQDDARFVIMVVDYAGEGLTIWNRSETFIDARNSPDSNALQSTANDELRNRRPRKVFSGKYVDTPSIKYGVQFQYGDYLTAVWDNSQLDMRVISTSLKVNNKQETVAIGLRSD